jgi:photosystem II stability/assembly factor-like uncharacterized protein
MNMEGLICVSPNGEDLTDCHEPIALIAVGTIDGVLFIERSPGGAWIPVQHVLRGVHISSLLHDPDTGAIFAGAHSGGFFASEDGGVTWEPRNRGLSQLHVYTIASRISAGKRLMYAGTEPAHLYVSADCGRLWEELPGLRKVRGIENWTFPAPPHLGHVKQITFHPRDERTLFACVEQGALLCSKDAGESWVELDAFHAPERHRYFKDVHRLKISTTSPPVMFLTGGDGIFRTEDGGLSWRQLTDSTMSIGYPDDFHIVFDDPLQIVVSGAAVDPGRWPETGTADASIKRSTDGGVRWLPSVGLPAPLHGHVSAMSMNAFGECRELFAATTDGELFGSFDGGASWRLLLNDLPPVAKANHFQRLPKRAPAL